MREQVCQAVNIFCAAVAPLFFDHCNTTEVNPLRSRSSFLTLANNILSTLTNPRYNALHRRGAKLMSVDDEFLEIPVVVFVTTCQIERVH